MTIMTYYRRGTMVGLVRTGATQGERRLRTPFLTAVSSFSPNQKKKVPSVMAASRSEQARLEELWEASRQSYEQARRRQISVEWIGYHERLAGAFRGHVAHHEREQELYRQILQDICAIKGGEGIET